MTNISHHTEDSSHLHIGECEHVKPVAQLLIDHGADTKAQNDQLLCKPEEATLSWNYGVLLL